MIQTLTVGQLNRYIRSVLEGDNKLSELYIKGEISNFVHHSASGHMYFTLKDSSSSIRAVMFRSYAQDVKFCPQNGLSVLVRASLGVFEKEGSYQLYVTDILPHGQGALNLAFEQLKQKLGALGYFEESRKRPLPIFPQKIGVVTSENGAALQDIIHILGRRSPLSTLCVIPALVQGATAANSVANAIAFASSHAVCDVLIVARGGGSLEDLWCFNEEVVAQAVYNCAIPVISAVGHETDYTICDFVADVRAPTPSAAAEIVSQGMVDIKKSLAFWQKELHSSAQRLLYSRQEQLLKIQQSPALLSPLHYLRQNTEKLDFSKKMLYNNMCIFMQAKQAELKASASLMESLSPLRVLARGYSVVFKDGHAVSSVGALHAGDLIELRMQDGNVPAEIQPKAQEDTE